MSLESAVAEFDSLFQDSKLLFNEAAKLYPNEKPVGLHAIIFSCFFRADIKSALQARATAGTAPGWMYQFTWQSPMIDGAPRSYHGLDLPFVFANAQKCAQATGGGSEVLALEAMMADAWLAFARNGSPQHQALPHWPEVSTQRLPSLMFDDKALVMDDYDRSLVELVTRSAKI